MRKLIYLSLIGRLKGLKDDAGQPEVKHFDLWNEQVEFIEQEEPFGIPAVFVEFRPVRWATLGGMVQQADVDIRLHIVTRWKGSAKDGSLFLTDALERFDLLNRIDRCLFNLQEAEGGTSFCMFRRTGSSTNHNHDELVEDIADYTCKATEQLTMDN